MKLVACTNNLGCKNLYKIAYRPKNGVIPDNSKIIPKSINTKQYPQISVYYIFTVVKVSAKIIFLSENDYIFTSYPISYISKVLGQNF